MTAKQTSSQKAAIALHKSNVKLGVGESYIWEAHHAIYLAQWFKNKPNWKMTLAMHDSHKEVQKELLPLSIDDLFDSWVAIKHKYPPPMLKLSPGKLGGAFLAPPLPQFQIPKPELTTPIYTPGGNSIQTGAKGRLEIEEEVNTHNTPEEIPYPPDGHDEDLADTGECQCSICFQDEGSIAIRTWGIDRELKLSREAADFYLLYDLSLDGNAVEVFNDKVTYLCAQFAAYTDMAIGGELRHLEGRASWDADIPKRLTDSFSKNYMTYSRGAAWKGWKRLRKMYGVGLLDDAIKGFAAFSKGGFGGERWAYITKILKQYETNEITPLLFLDICWGLEHNGGCYFSKTWNDIHLKKVLDANLHWQVDVLYNFASHDIRTLHEDFQEGK